MIARHALMPRLQAAAPPAKAAVAKVVAMALEDLAESVPFGARPGSRLTALQPEFGRCAEVFDIWLRDMVTAGSFALAITDGSPNADPDDVVTQAEAVIADDATLASAFMQPTPDDPLGTAPRYGLTAIGRAIEVARSSARPTTTGSRCSALPIPHLASLPPCCATNACACWTTCEL